MPGIYTRHQWQNCRKGSDLCRGIYTRGRDRRWIAGKCRRSIYTRRYLPAILGQNAMKLGAAPPALLRALESQGNPPGVWREAEFARILEDHRAQWPGGRSGSLERLLD